MFVRYYNGVHLKYSKLLQTAAEEVHRTTRMLHFPLRWPEEGRFPQQKLAAKLPHEATGARACDYWSRYAKPGSQEAPKAPTSTSQTIKLIKM